MNVLVTGANGQLGRELRVLSATAKALTFHFYTSKELDITDKVSCAAILKQIQPSFLLNCAAYTAVDRAEEEGEKAFAVNAHAVRHLAAECAIHHCQFIHISSDYVYHNNLNRPLLESDPTTPKGVYAASKLQGDLGALEENAHSIILRTSWIYSSFGHNFLKTMLRLGKEREQLNIVYDQIGAPTYARDIADTILTIIDKVNTSKQSFGGIYNYAPQGVTCWYDYVNAIFEMANIHCQVNSILSKAYPTPAQRPTYSVLNCKKIETTFDVERPYWKDSVKDCLEILLSERQ